MACGSYDDILDVLVSEKFQKQTDPFSKGIPTDFCLRCDSFFLCLSRRDKDFHLVLFGLDSYDPLVMERGFAEELRRCSEYRHF